MTTIAGDGTQASTDGTGTAAQFARPRGLTLVGTDLYIIGFDNHLIRKLDLTTNVVTTFAGTGTSGSADGTGTAASFNSLYFITNDGTNLYVTEQGNHRIRQIVISSGVVTTLAGSSSGFTDATGTAAQFQEPAGITTDGVNLYVSDSLNNRIRKIVIATGVVTTLAGSGTAGVADGTGTAATFNDPRGIITDGVNLYVVQVGGTTDSIRKIVIATGVVTTTAGSLSQGSTNGTGTAASFATPWGIVSDGLNLYVSELVNNRIRKIE